MFQVNELLEFKRRKKGDTAEDGKAAKGKRVPTVKKELGSQKETLLTGDDTQGQSGRPLHIEVPNHINEMPEEATKDEVTEILCSRFLTKS